MVMLSSLVCLVPRAVPVLFRDSRGTKPYLRSLGHLTGISMWVATQGFTAEVTASNPRFLLCGLPLATRFFPRVAVGNQGLS